MVDIVMWNWIIVVSLTVTIAVCLLGEYKNVQYDNVCFGLVLGYWYNDWIIFTSKARGEK